jgi:hypothetical protein
MKKHFNIHVFGKVQGVWYRASTQRKAEELGLQGFVRTRPTEASMSKRRAKRRLYKPWSPGAKTAHPAPAWNESIRAKGNGKDSKDFK